MSLETVYVRLRTIQQIPFWKFAFFTGLLPALISVLVISFLFNASAISPLQVPILELVLLTVFTITYLASAVIGIVFVIALSVILIKIRNQFYKSNGVMIGNSLSTNHDFLRKFAKGLFPHLIGLFKSYNDPRFETIESRQLNTENEIDELRGEMERKFKVKDLVINKEHNLRIQAERELEEYKKKDSVKKQQIGKNIDAQDLNENTKIDDQNTKFERKN